MFYICLKKAAYFKRLRAVKYNKGYTLPSIAHDATIPDAYNHITVSCHTNQAFNKSTNRICLPFSLSNCDIDWLPRFVLARKSPLFDYLILSIVFSFTGWIDL
jgi:hypothetical protein